MLTPRKIKLGSAGATGPSAGSAFVSLSQSFPHGPEHEPDSALSLNCRNVAPGSALHVRGIGELGAVATVCIEDGKAQKNPSIVVPFYNSTRQHPHPAAEGVFSVLI